MLSLGLVLGPVLGPTLAMRSPILTLMLGQHPGALCEYSFACHMLWDWPSR